MDMFMNKYAWQQPFYVGNTAKWPVQIIAQGNLPYVIDVPIRTQGLRTAFNRTIEI